MNATTAAWPPAEGLTTQNVPRAETTLTSYGSARIKAPASDVFETLLNVSEYDQWNSFCPKVTIQVQPDGVPESTKLHVGTMFTFMAVMDASKPHKETPTQLKITDICTPSHPSSYVPTSTLESDGSYTADLSKVYRVSWKCEGGFVAKGLKTERFHEVIIIGENECEVRTWENQGGILAHTVRWMYKKTLMEKFQSWCDDLKKHCEEKANET